MKLTRKTRLLISLLTILCISMSSFAYADTWMQQSQYDQEIKPVNGEITELYNFNNVFYGLTAYGRQINKTVYDITKEDRGTCIAYGSREEKVTVAGDAERYRYLGYTNNGDKYTNFQFPDDISNSTKLTGRNYLTVNQMTDSSVKNKMGSSCRAIADNIQRNYFANNIMTDTKLHSSFIAGLKMRFDPSAYPSLPANFFDGIETYNWAGKVHIIQPPTQTTNGFALLIYNNSGYRYFTVPMVAFEKAEEIIEQPPAIDGENLILKITDYSKSVPAGGQATIKYSITNQGKHPITSVNWYIDGNLDKTTESITLLPGQTKNLVENLIIAQGSHTITATVNPNKDNPKDEINWADNTDNCAITGTAVAANDTGKITIRCTDKQPIDINSYMENKQPLVFNYVVEIDTPGSSDYTVPYRVTNTKITGQKFTKAYF